MGSSCIVCKSFSDNEATSCSFVDFFKIAKLVNALLDVGAGMSETWRFFALSSR
jgi:hypothetical protein